MKRILFCALVLIGIGSALVLAAMRISSARTAADLDWANYGNDLSNTRYQNVDQINPSNVGRLRPAWVFHTGVLDTMASLEVSPIVIGGSMYVTSGHDDVFALNATTGQQIWAYHPQLLAPLSKLNLCCGRVNRGVAFGDGKLFLARLDGVLEALDPQSGHVLWHKVFVDFNQGFSLTMAPQFANGLVIVGSSGGEFKSHGQLAAFDAKSGNEIWHTFTTLPGPSWAGDSWRRGGAPVWQTPAVDPSLGLVYINTGNAAPDINGEHRAGNNLFSASLVALDIANGHLRWGFQETHHDMWDYDSAQPSVLFTLHRNGVDLPALGECSKNGNYYILDRRSGAPLYAVNETAVPTDPAWQNAAPTQPLSSVEPLTPLGFLPGTIDLTKLPHDIKLAPHYTPPEEQKLLMQPGDDGGCEFPPAAFSPRTQYVYYGTRYEPAEYQTHRGNNSFKGSTFSEIIPGVTDFGIFGATDTQTGRVKWKINVPQPAKSGMLVAGDLVFFGEGNGKFHGVDARTGQMLFTFDGTKVPHSGGAQAAPIAYTAGGKEFIVNAFGGNTADAQFAPNPTGDAIIAFSLP